MKEKMSFITTRQAAWDRLAVLAEIEVKTEAERYEEEILSRLFWELGELDAHIRYGPLLGFDSTGYTPVQRRIVYMARFQEPGCEDCWRSNYLRDGVIRRVSTSTPSGIEWLEKQKEGMTNEH